MHVMHVPHDWGPAAAAGNGVNGIQFPTWFFGDRVVNESSTPTDFIQTDWIAASAQLKPGTIPAGLEAGNKYFNYYLCAPSSFPAPSDKHCP